MRRSAPSGDTVTLEEVTGPHGLVTSRVRRTTLPSGLRVVTEHLAGVRSASIGVWVGVGSRDEARSLHGASHFLEHLLFKGTAGRSALDISVELDEVGGEVNAFTTKEYTCFHARVLDADVPVAVDVLGDMVAGSRVDAADVEAERDVILDEIAMHDDDPDDVAHNLLAAQAWGDAPLGRPVAGTAASVAALTREQVRRFYGRHYRPGNTVVAVAGNVEHDRVVATVSRAFDRGGFLDRADEPARPRAVARARGVSPGVRRTKRPFEQVNLVLGVRGLTRSDPRRFALGVLTTVLGGGASSRLFQEVRERRGLAYSVYAFADHHVDAGLVGVAAGCLPGRDEELLATVRHELGRLAADGVTEAELVRGQGQLRAGLVLGLEDSTARMARIAKAELVHDGLLGVDDLIARIDAVTLDEVRSLARSLFAQRELLAVVGPA